MVVRKLREKCKDAARMRREKERSEFVELSKLLPLPSSTTSQLDKASIIRLTSSYLRMRAAFPEGLGANWGTRKLTSSSSSSNCNARVASCSPSSAANDVAHYQHNTTDSTSSGHSLTRQQTSLNKQTLRNLMIQQPSQQQQLHQRQLQKQQQTQIKELGSLILQTLDGFVFALHRDGKIMYISETASVLLGLPQIDLTGSSVFDYVHPADHNDISEMLSLNDTDKQEIQAQSNVAGHTDTDHLEMGRSFSMRLKCILPKRNAGLIQNGYKSIHCTGYLKIKRNRRQHQQPLQTQLNSSSSDESVGDRCQFYGKDTALNLPPTHGEDNSDWESYALVAVGHSLLPSASTEIKLNTNSFMFRANLDMKIYYMETSAVNSLGHQQSSLVGQSLYQLVHLADLKQLEEAHRSLLSKSQVVSKYFRLMRREGGYVWVQMQATLINNPRSMPKPLHIVGICIIIGDNHDDRSLLLLNEPSSVIQNEPGKMNCNNSLEIQVHQPNQRRKLTRTHSGSNSLLTIKDGACKPILASHKRAPAKRRERSGLPIKRTRQSGEDNSHDALKLIDENHRDTIIQLAPMVNQAMNRSRDSLRIDRSYNKTIGTVRRFSDDTCSVASNMTSASTTSGVMIPNGNQIVVSCPSSSASSCSSSSSICSPSSLSLSRTSNAMRSSNQYLPTQFHQTQPTIPEAFAPMETSQQEQQLQCCVPTAIVNNADLGHFYIDHAQYQPNNYWPPQNERLATNHNVNRCNDAVQFRAKQLQHILPEQYYYNIDEQHLDTDNQSMHYYHYGSNESAFYTGSSSASLQIGEAKCGMDNNVSDQLSHYQYPYPMANHTTRESMSVTPMTSAVMPCSAAAHQSF